jgi:hypothetical protein
MVTTQRVGQFTTPTGTGTQNAVLTMFSGNTTTCPYPIAPQLQNYNVDIISQMVRMFQRYEVESFRFRYIPASGTAASGRLKMVILDDPANAFTAFNITSDTSLLVSTTALDGKTDLVDIPGYAPGATRWYSPKKFTDMRYVGGPIDTDSTSSTGQVSYNDDSAGLRDQVQAVMLYLFNDCPAATLMGDLFMDFRVNLCDFGKSVTGATTDGLA